MTQIRLITPPERPKSRWQKLGRLAGVLLVLLIVFYFVATSGLFLKKVILPTVSNALKADITVADAQLSPFRQIVLRDLKLQPRGQEQLLSVQEVRLKYSLISILRGNIKVSEVTVESPTVNVVVNPDGSSNLDPFLKKSAKEPSSGQSSEVPKLNVKLVALNNATVRFTKKHSTGAPDIAAVTNLNFKLQDLQNGQAGKLDLAANLAVDQAASNGKPASALQVKLDGGFAFDLLADLKPASVKGDLGVAVENAAGDFAEMAAVGVRLNCETTATEIKQVALRFTKADAALGEVRVSGPLDLDKMEGKLKLEILSLDRRVLNLAGAASGIDFGPTTINGSTDIELQRKGAAISLAGQLEVAHLQLTKQGRVSPTLDLRCDYAALIDRAAQTAELRFLNLTGAQNSHPFLRSELPQALTISWGETASTASDATFKINLTELNLADWRSFLGDNSLAGNVSGKLQLTSSNGGKQLHVDLSGGLDKFSITAGSNRIDQADLRLAAKARATDLKDFQLEEGRFELVQQDQPALVATVSGSAQNGGQDADGKLSVQMTLARLFSVVQSPGLKISSGTVDLQAQLHKQAQLQKLTGKLTLANCSGTQGDLRWDRYGAGFDFDIASQEHALEVQKFTGSLRAGDKPAGRVDVGAKLDFASGHPAGRVILKLMDVNQELLRPFVASALGERKLMSVAIGSSVTLDLESNADLKVVADTQVTNLVVLDPAHPGLSSPLQARLQLDTAVTGGAAQINQGRLTLTPTSRAKNELNLTGTVDTSKPEAITGSLKLAAEALDFTKYYDLLARNAQTNAAEVAATPVPTASSGSETEPAPVVTPLSDFTCEIEIGHLYLREMDIANWHSTAKVAGSQITLQPCKFNVNGAPVDVNLDANLGVPGYRYAVGFNALSVPLTPLVNSFASDRAGQIGGQLTANLNLKGAGVTGASLQTNLTGQFKVLATNLNLSISNVRSPILNIIINTVIGLPDLIAGLSGKRDAAQMKWADEITAKPIDVLSANGDAGSGKVELMQAQVHSAAFQVQTAGEIQLAEVLTNSTLQFPVHVALGRPYAAKLGMVNASTPTNAAYLALPDFLTVKGTLGAVKPEISKTGLTVLAGKTLGGIGKEFGLSVGDLGKSIGGAASGLFKETFGTGDTNAASATETNTAAEPKKKSIFDIFKREKKE